MKKKEQLYEQIVNGMHSLSYVWKDELKKIFKDSGVMIFFILVPVIYPIIYGAVYSKEVVRDAKMVVVDASDTYLSREFVRRVDASPDVKVVDVLRDMEKARRMVDEGKAYGILFIPGDFSKILHKNEEQAHISVYCDMSSLLYYKAFLLTATEVSLEMGSEWQKRNKSAYTVEMENIAVHPIPSESITMFNPAGGFSSFLLPGILILVIQQTLILGIGMLSGTARERNRFNTIVPINKHYKGTLRVVMGKALAYLLVYAVMCIWVFIVVPRIFDLPRLAQPIMLLTFLLPYLLASIFLAMTLSGLMKSRESPMLVFLFLSVPLLFMSGITWPREGIPTFWRMFGYLFPSTGAIHGYIRINSMGASLYDVAFEYRLLWFQVGVYFLTTCLIYRHQINRMRKLILRHYSYMKIYFRKKSQTSQRPIE